MAVLRAVTSATVNKFALIQSREPDAMFSLCDKSKANIG